MYDVIVIGGGPGGYRAAELLGKSKRKVALIEKREIGGVCLNQGCIPFKTYLHGTQLMNEYLSLLHRGIIIGDSARINQKRLYETKQNIVNGLRQSVTQMLKASGVDIYNAEAKIIKEECGCFKIKIGCDVVEGERLVIAAGSKEKEFLNVQDATDVTILTSEKMLEMTTIPESIDIVGGGVIGLEAASFLAGVGCEVTIIEATDHIGGQIDSEISAVVQDILRKKGISILTDTFLLRFEGDEVIYQGGENCISRKPKSILASMGRKPYIDEDMLRALGVRFADTGIMINESCVTSNPRIYACGDVTGKMMLAHTAYRQAKVIFDDICGIKSSVDYDIIPRIIYSNPQILSVGLSEDECKSRQIEYQAKMLPMTYSGKYFAEHGKDGARAKMLIDADKRVVGIHIVGDDIAELSLVGEFMVMNRMSTEEILNLTIAHPTYGEIMAELAASFN